MANLFGSLICVQNPKRTLTLKTEGVSVIHKFFSFQIQHEGLEKEITRRTLTHTSWDISFSKERERRGWHPVTYKLADATPVLIQSIKVLS